MAGLTVMVTEVRRFGDRTTPGALRLAAASTVARATREAGGILLEPMMEAEVTAPQAYIGTILHDLTANRRAHIHSVDAPMGNHDGIGRTALQRSKPRAWARESAGQGLAPGLDSRRHEIRVSVPLRELLGYATTLRSISAGEGSFTMELGGYAKMDAEAQRTVLEGEW